MLKYRYNYEETNATASTFTYATGKQKARIDFLAKGLYRVAMWKEGERLLPTWAVAPGDTKMPREGRERLSIDGFPMEVPKVSKKDSLHDSMGNDRQVIFSLPEAEVVLSLPGFSFEVRVKVENKTKQLFSDRPYSPYNYNGELGEGASHFLKAERYEEIFGLGEKSGKVNRFGRSFTIGARDAMGYDASSSDPLYKHMPFYICRNSVGTYGIYYDTHAKGSMNFMEEMDNYYGHFKSFACEDNALVYYVFLGSIKEISTRFAWLCGRSVFSPKWSLDYHGSTMTYTDAENADEKLRGFLAKCKENDLKCSGFYLSSGYTSIGSKRYVFHWNKDKIPDPIDLIQTFKEAGVHFIPNIKPAFLEDHPMYEMIAEKGWFLHYPDGTPAKLPFWDGYGSYLDFTNPGAFDFWTSMAKEKLIDYGMDALWNDNNEYYLADREIMAAGFGNPIPAYRICQVFPMLMVMASNAAFGETTKRHMMSTRSGGAGINRLAQTWTGDNYTSFQDLHYNHKMAVNMSISGIPLFGHDLGGFAGPAPGKELLLRWLQYGTLLPRFCIHSWNDGGNATEPWMYPDCLETVHRLFAFRNRIRPQLYQLLYRVHKNYDTFITPLFVDFPEEDPESDLFLLGHEVLCALVFQEGADEVIVKLPGEIGWYADISFDQAESYYRAKEGKELRFPCGMKDLPVLLHKEGTIFMENDAAYAANQDQESLLYRIYAVEKGTFFAEFFEDDGITKEEYGNGITTTIQVRCTESEVLVSGIPNGRKVHVADYLHRTVKMKTEA